MSVNEPRTSETRSGEVNLADEVREFGRQLSAVIRTVRESPRAREIEQQVANAMRDVERQVNEALGTVRDKAQPQTMKETLKGAATTAADETQRGLARGLHALNERLARAVQESERARATEAASSGTASATATGAGDGNGAEPMVSLEGSPSANPSTASTGSQLAEPARFTADFSGPEATRSGMETGASGANSPVDDAGITASDQLQPGVSESSTDTYLGETEPAQTTQTQAGPVFAKDPDTGNKEPGDLTPDTFPTGGFLGPAGSSDVPRE